MCDVNPPACRLAAILADDGKDKVTVCFSAQVKPRRLVSCIVPPDNVIDGVPIITGKA